MNDKTIAHLCLTTSPFKDKTGYQENLLAQKHVELGFSTYVVSYSLDCPKGNQFVNDNGVKVIYLPLNRHYHFQPEGFRQTLRNSFSCKTIGLDESLQLLRPDIIFVHGPKAWDNLAVCRYRQAHPEVKVYCDSHSDYYNTPIDRLSKRLIQKVYCRYLAKRLERVSERMWGVTPWRVDYLQKVYGIRPEHTGLLVMGGDENRIDFARKAQIRAQIRQDRQIPQDDFLLVSGGKIDPAKNIQLLAEALDWLEQSAEVPAAPRISLLLFGKFSSEMAALEEKLAQHPRVRYIGWVGSDDVYPLFLASDLGVFPGTHSVLWEQACASGLPCLFKDWGPMMHHVDAGGNCRFLQDVTAPQLGQLLLQLAQPDSSAQPETGVQPDSSAQPAASTEYRQMLSAAERVRHRFSYLEIAKKAIGIDSRC